VGGRVGWVDAARGAAVLLMVLDHVLARSGLAPWLRAGSPLAVTRLSLPLFLLAAAAVWRPRAWKRYGRLLAVVPAEFVLYVALGLPLPGIVALVVVVALVLDVVTAAAGGRELDPYVLVVVGLVQALYVPLQLSWWGNYQPGLVLAWWGIGRLVVLLHEARPASYRAGLVLVRPAAWLRAVGRRPLVWYVGHLLVLVVVWKVLG
jgi:hypothetical protein